MLSKHGPYLVFSLISGLPIKPGRTSEAMLVEASGVIVVEASGGGTVHQKRDHLKLTLFIKKLKYYLTNK